MYYLDELLVSMALLGLSSRIVRFSVWVGVTTVVVPPVQLPVSSLKKLGFLLLWVAVEVKGCGGGKGTTNPSRSIVSNLFKQSSAWKRSVMDWSVVGVKTGVWGEALSLFSTMSKPKLLVSSLFWTIAIASDLRRHSSFLMKLQMSHLVNHQNNVWLDGLFKS